LFSAILFFPLFNPSFAISKINITVKTILASQDKAYIDPQLKDIVKELQSVFRYTSYRLLSRDGMQLDMKQTGTVSLPGKRILRITPIRTAANRAQLKVEILKGNQQVFQTTIQLVNRGSMTIGGPQHERGYLLLNISNYF
jgi:hypothetical protein